MITKPTLLLDEKKCKENIHRMYSKSQSCGLDFRPHFKTHRSLEIGNWFKEIGVNKITVSSVTMAEYFSSDWNDITIAFPTNLLEIDSINSLAQRIKLNLCIENEEVILSLSENLKFHANIFLKIDVGNHRTGIDPSEKRLMEIILAQIDKSPLMTMKGFLGHAGHTYKYRTQEQIEKVHSGSIDIMNELKENYINRYPNLIISLGDTPSCSVIENYAGVDEIRPGNFVFYDLTQTKIGSNNISQIAVALACPIVAKHKKRNELIIYGGGVHFSKDSLEDQEGVIYGRVVKKLDLGWGNIIPNMFVKSLSQEHGIVSVPTDLFDNYKVGDYLIILPVHSCMTANLMKSYQTFDGRIISSLSY